MNPQAELIDGWKRNREHPNTFQVPSVRELMKLRPGMYAKLGVEWDGECNPRTHEPGAKRGERFWVEVTENEFGPPLAGIVRQSDMLFTELHGVADGDTIFFQPCHILGIFDKNNS